MGPLAVASGGYPVVIGPTSGDVCSSNRLQDTVVRKRMLLSGGKMKKRIEGEVEVTAIVGAFEQDVKALGLAEVTQFTNIAVRGCRLKVSVRVADNREDRNEGE
jgi:hypothetical protein